MSPNERGDPKRGFPLGGHLSTFRSDGVVQTVLDSDRQQR